MDLPDNGSISMADAKRKAALEYDAFNKQQKITSDFDKQIETMIDAIIDRKSTTVPRVIADRETGLRFLLASKRS